MWASKQAQVFRRQESEKNIFLRLKNEDFYSRKYVRTYVVTVGGTVRICALGPLLERAIDRSIEQANPASGWTGEMNGD